MHSQQEDHLLAKPTVWLLFAFLLSLKCFLIGSYRSTDFEVHRNWMAITHNFPLEQWYQSNISQWTLDYPPFFAYFEWLLANTADLFEPAILTLQSEPFISIETILFQRLSVIAVDLIYFISCACISSSHVDRTSAKGYAFRQRMSLGLCTFLVCNPALIMLDNIHFQYNGFLYAIFLLSLNAIINGKLLRGALLFAILLNFKHLYLYYAPAFIGFFFCSYLMPFNRTFFIRTLQLGLVLTAIFCLSFGPFLLKGGIDSFYQILGRLFPFKRGLTHANWAPNFWALYNFMDFILAKIFGKVCHYTKYSSLLPLKKCPPTAPEYIRGLVKEYGHSVLPDITPPITLALILVSLTPCFTLFARTKKQATSAGALLPCLTLSAFSFFLFGWHVHEKAILMVFFPFALLSVKDPSFLEPFCLLCIASTFAQFPLLFTPIEILVKWALVLAFFCLSVFLANHIWAIHPAELVRCPVAKLLARGMFLAEFYTLFHPVFFGSTQFSFMPILISSVACALAVFYSYLSLLITLFGQQMGLLIQNRKLLKKEKDAEKEVPLLDMETVKYIAGIDLSQSVSQPSMAVVTLTVLAYPSMEVVYTANEVVMLSSLGGVMPYVPEFLAIREAKPLRRVLSRHLPQCPKIDLLFVDSNGKWHSRGLDSDTGFLTFLVVFLGCGLACHVGFDIGVPTIGLAKNFNGFPLFALGLCEREQLQEIEQQIGRKCKESTEEAAIFEFLLNSSNVNSSSRCPGLAILRTKTSNSPFFVSPGFGISFESAMAMAFECIGKQSASVNPVRLSDLRSRRRVQEIFEE